MLLAFSGWKMNRTAPSPLTTKKLKMSAVPKSKNPAFIGGPGKLSPPEIDLMKGTLSKKAGGA